MVMVLKNFQRGGDNAGVEATRKHNGTRTVVN